jgi:hypothetical protein
VSALARVRALHAELGQALEELDAEQARPRARKGGPRRRRTAPAPEQMPSQAAIDDMQRTLRRKGFET